MITRATLSTVEQGLPKYRSMLAGNTAYNPYSYESIATTTVGAGGTSSVTFSSIPSTYTNLELRIRCQTNRGTYGTDSYYLQFNSVTGSSYDYGMLRGNGSSTATYHGNAATTSIEVGSASGTTIGGTFGVGVIHISDYANTNKFKTVRALTGVDINGTIAGSGGFAYLTSGLFASTNAISSIQLTFDNTVQQYSSFALYGIKGA